MAVVMGEDRDRAGMRDHLALHRRAVGTADLVQPHRNQLPAVGGPRADPLHHRSSFWASPGASRRAARASAVPEARAAAKKIGSSWGPRPITLDARPLVE